MPEFRVGQLVRYKGGYPRHKVLEDGPAGTPKYGFKEGQVGLIARLDVWHEKGEVIRFANGKLIRLEYAGNVHVDFNAANRKPFLLHTDFLEPIVYDGAAVSTMSLTALLDQCRQGAVHEEP